MQQHQSQQVGSFLPNPSARRGRWPGLRSGARSVRRALSSVVERVPYKHVAGGSSPSAPTSPLAIRVFTLPASPARHPKCWPCLPSWSAALIGQRTRDALAVRKAQGVRLGRPPVRPADVVSTIVRARRASASWSAIGRQLDAEGVATAQGGARWYPATVRTVLGIALNAGRTRTRSGTLASPKSPRYSTISVSSMPSFATCSVHRLPSQYRHWWRP